MSDYELLLLVDVGLIVAVLSLWNDVARMNRRLDAFLRTQADERDEKETL